MDDGVIPVTTTDIPVDALVTPSGLIPISPAAKERCHWSYSSLYWYTFFFLVQATHVQHWTWGGTRDPNIVSSFLDIIRQKFQIMSLPSVGTFFFFAWNAKVYLAVKSVMALWHWKQWWFNLSKSQLSINHSKCQFSVKFSGAFDVWSLVWGRTITVYKMNMYLASCIALVWLCDIQEKLATTFFYVPC